MCLNQIPWLFPKLQHVRTHSLNCPPVAHSAAYAQQVAQAEVSEKSSSSHSSLAVGCTRVPCTLSRSQSAIPLIPFRTPSTQHCLHLHSLSTQCQRWHFKRKDTLRCFQSLHYYLSLLYPNPNSWRHSRLESQHPVRSPHCLLFSWSFSIQLTFLLVQKVMIFPTEDYSSFLALCASQNMQHIHKTDF